MTGFKLIADVKSARRLGADIKSYLSVSERASSLTIKTAEKNLKNALRSDIRSAGLGNKLANTWRGETYPKGRDSMNASAFLWSKAPHIVDAFNRGVTIRAKGVRYLAIPTENTPKRIGRKKITPELYEASRGDLQFVKGSGGNAFLVATVQSSYSKKTKEFRGFRKASATALRTGKNVATAVMFILIPEARLRKRFDVERRVIAETRGLTDKLYAEKRKLLR